MAIGVTFPENEDVVTFWWKIERLVRVESKVDIYKKELGNYAGYRLRKVYWKDLHYWGMKISRDAVTHVVNESLLKGILKTWQNRDVFKVQQAFGMYVRSLVGGKSPRF